MTQSQDQKKRLYRVRSGRLLTGVVAGVAQYLGMPAMLLRLIVAVLTIMSGFWIGVLLYTILSFVIPEEPFGRDVAAPPIPGTPTPEPVVVEQPVAHAGDEIVVDAPQVTSEKTADADADADDVPEADDATATDAPAANDAQQD